MSRQESRPAVEGAVARIHQDQAAQLYWLAFLLPGDCACSFDAAVEALNTDDAANPFFGDWMVVWAKELVIAQALSAVSGELRASVLRTERRRFDYSNEMESVPRSAWKPGPDAPNRVLQNALLAIDLFPRCALLLMVFQKLSADDTVILLNADKDLVMTAN